MNQPGSLIRYLQGQKIAPDLMLPHLDRIHRPLCSWLHGRCAESPRPLLVGINGAQGTGKSTLSAMLQILLQEELGLQSIVLSLDDYYLGKSERNHLAERVHPLLSRRGVPGTHDLEQLSRHLEQLFAIQPGERVELSRFDKAADDCATPERWSCPPDGLDLILLEGWCVGARAEEDEALATPVNGLESHHDAEGVWRRFVNRALGERYQPLFSRLDHLVTLQPPDMESVVDWRTLQEEKLEGEQRERRALQEEIRLFVSHFERLTRHMWSELPQRSDILLTIGEDHQPDSIQFFHHPEEVQTRP